MTQTSQPLFKLTWVEANAPRPRREDYRFFADYCDDLACWKATQAERYLSGIEDTPQKP